VVRDPRGREHFTFESPPLRLADGRRPVDVANAGDAAVQHLREALELAPADRVFAGVHVRAQRVEQRPGIVEIGVDGFEVAAGFALEVDLRNPMLPRQNQQKSANRRERPQQRGYHDDDVPRTIQPLRGNDHRRTKGNAARRSR